MERNQGKQTDDKSNNLHINRDNEDPDYEQNGKFFTEDSEADPKGNLKHHGRPLSDAELEELRLHKSNNEFLGIKDIPEAGTGAGNVGGVIPDATDLQESTDAIDDKEGRDSNFGRNYNGGNQSQNQFIRTNSRAEKKKEETDEE